MAADRNALTALDLGEGDSDGLGADQDLARPGLRLLHLFEAQYGRCAVLVVADDSHDFSKQVSVGPSRIAVA